MDADFDIWRSDTGTTPARLAAGETWAPSPASRPWASIVVRTYGERSEFLAEALDSLLAQTYRPLEIVVVEDGSSHARAMLMGRRLDAGQSLVHLALPKSGRCVGGNRGLAIARGELLGFLDDDDLLLPRHLELLAEPLLARPELGAAYGLAEETPTRIESLAPLRYVELGRYVACRAPFDRGLLQSRNYLPIQSVLFRRRLFERWGGFDLELDCLEDWDLWRRYASQDDFVLVPQVTSRHRVPGDSLTAARRFRQLESYRPRFEALQAARALQHAPNAAPSQLSNCQAGTAGDVAARGVAGGGMSSHFNRTQSGGIRQRAKGAVRTSARRLLARQLWLYRVYWHVRRFRLARQSPA